MKQQKIQQIVDEVLEGKQESIEALPELLKDEAFRKEYLSLMIDESLLTTALELEAKKRQFKKKSKKKLVFSGVLALAAALVFAFIILKPFEESRNVLVVTGTESLAQGKVLKAGDKLSLSAKGKVTLEFYDKSQVTLLAPFFCELLENGISLEQGYLEANINKREKDKFSVKTADCEIDVLGTSFSVSANKGSTQLQVSKGLVKIKKGNESLEVEKGQFALASSSVPFKVYSEKKKDLPSEVWLERYKHRIQSDLQSEDLVCLYTFDGDKTLKNKAGDDLHGDIPKGVVEATGRYGKAARLFDDSTGAVIECGHQESLHLKDFTAVVWCKANAKVENNVLFSQRDFNPDYPGGWSIHIIDGFLTVWLVTGIQKNGVIEWAKKRIVPFPLNKWTQVALSIKGEEISVYMNGEKVREMSIKWNPAKHIRHQAIGGIDEMSFHYRNKERPRNIFNGIIDEVRLYKKALSEEDVLELYDFGKVD